MNILITGGKGFIGTHLCNALKTKHNISTVDIKTMVIEDITDPHYMNIQFEKYKPDLVIHLAAQSLLRNSIQNPYADAMTNIIGSINILEVCRKYNVKRIIYASTGGARYGDICDVVNENYEVKPISPYGISKHTVEHYLEFYHREHGLEYSVLCFGNIYGPGDHVNNGRIITKTIDCNLRDKELIVYGNGLAKRDYLYIDDLIEFIINNLENDKIYGEIVNLGTSLWSTVLDIIRAVDYISNKETPVKYVESFKSEVDMISLDPSKAKLLTGWVSSTSLFKGIEQTYNWFKDKL